LLHVTARLAREFGLQLHALHVHHGLVAGADDWLARLRTQCARWARSGLPLSFHATRLTTAPAAGESIEAWARRARYEALAVMARAAGCDLVLLAHHRRDQAETLLLQALRGGGPAGLAAMPRSACRDGITWARPWLDLPREAVQAYVGQHRLSYVDDVSNDDDRFARNRLRRQVWPALSRAFPDAEAQLAAAARRAAEAAAVLAEVAADDMAACASEGGLQLACWTRLSQARRAGVLREWLRHMLAGRATPESLVQRLRVELPGRRGGSWPAPGGELRLHDGILRYGAAASPVAGGALALDLGRPGSHGAPGWQGHFVVRRVDAGGIAPSRLQQATVRMREGGEAFRFSPKAAARNLKKQFQARRVPTWERDGPLVFDGELLLYVPGLGINGAAVAAPGEAQLSLHWQAQDPVRRRDKI
jgi:tRNA(Ile)-lysidine synthase